MPIHHLHRFLKSDSGTGLVLFLVLCLTLIIANSPYHDTYFQLIALPIDLHLGNWDLNKPALLWINEGLMALFFMSLTLEIKEARLTGHLAHFSQALLPGLAAVGGVVTPMLIYLACTHTTPTLQQGWPIPTATDVALSLGAVAALGKWVPASLRTFLMTLAIIDDIIAIFIIAMVYHNNLALSSLAFAAVGISGLILLRCCRIIRLAPYLLIGIFIWACVLRSGVHATLAGVVVGLFIPSDNMQSPAHHLQKLLTPWVNYFILPVFIFWNSGLSFSHFTFRDLISPLSLGVILGLWLGKCLGIFIATQLALRCKLGRHPQGATQLDLLGIAALGGIGFTMSLFLASLSFDVSFAATLAHQAIFVGSLLSLATGTGLFYLARCMQKL